VRVLASHGFSVYSLRLSRVVAFARERGATNV
jgi:hypothetical protein